MSTLAELPVSSHVKLLVVGEAGVGKTVFACSGPGKTHVFDFDTKLGSAASFYKKTNPEKLKDIEYTTLSLASQSGKTYQDFDRKLGELEALSMAQKFPFQTVVVDSLTLYSDALMNYFIALNPGLKRETLKGVTLPVLKDYHAFGALFRKDMHRLLALPCHVICTAHPLVEKEENEPTKYGILLSGKVAAHLPRIFTEVYFAVVKRKQAQAPGQPSEIRRIAITQSDGTYVCRSQITGLPHEIPLDFKTVIKYAEASNA